MLLALLLTTFGQALASDNYERQLIGDALQSGNLVEESAPTGKTVERIVVATRAVIDEYEPWPSFLNLFHVVTAPDVVERELLFKTGQPWDSDRAYESERNLRSYLFLSVSKIVAAKGSSPDRVVAVIVTKDRWSLRLNSDFSYIGSTLEYLLLEIEEQNLVGRTKRVSGDFQLNLASFAFGQSVNDPRVNGTRIAASERATLIFNRESGRPEGYTASLSVGQPLYSLDTRWAWSVTGSLRNDLFRLFSNQQIAQVPLAGQNVPFVYRQRVADATAAVTRSYGRAYKQNVSVGARVYGRDFSLPAGPVALTPAAIDAFRSNYLPANENAALALVNYQAFRAEYRMVTDLQTFSLTEDLRLGPTTELELRAGSFLEGNAALGWTWLFANDDILTLSASAAARNQSGRLAGRDWVNQTYSLQLRNISPAFWERWLRVHAFARYTRRFGDLNRTLETLGGDGPLRGYPSAYLVGSQVLTTNLELRTRSIRIASAHIGAAAFHDAGTAFVRPENFHLFQSVGAGLRVLFPEFNRAVIRADFGMPLEATPGTTPTYFALEFGQAF
jgi:hypothetical protein